jgi:hypothetical protein
MNRCGILLRNLILFTAEAENNRDNTDGTTRGKSFPFKAMEQDRHDLILLAEKAVAERPFTKVTPRGSCQLTCMEGKGLSSLSRYEYGIMQKKLLTQTPLRVLFIILTNRRLINKTW